MQGIPGILALLSLLASLTAVHAADSGHSAHGGYYDRNNRWITSYRSDMEGNLVEDPPSIWDGNFEENLASQLFSYPSFEEHAAMCRQLDSVRLGRDASRQIPPQEQSMRAQRAPPNDPNLRGADTRATRGGRGMQRGRNIGPEYGGQAMPPSRARDTGRPPMMAQSQAEYGVRSSAAMRQAANYDSSRHEADLIPRRRRGPTPDASSVPAAREARLPLSDPNAGISSSSRQQASGARGRGVVRGGRGAAHQ